MSCWGPGLYKNIIYTYIYIKVPQCFVLASFLHNEDIARHGRLRYKGKQRRGRKRRRGGGTEETNEERSQPANTPHQPHALKLMSLLNVKNFLRFHCIFPSSDSRDNERIKV